MGTGTKGVRTGPGGMGIRMGITDMAERFGMEPIPKIKQTDYLRSFLEDLLVPYPLQILHMEHISDYTV